MIVVPVKLIPWLLLIVGIGGLIEGEEIPLSLGLIAAGGVWLYLRNKMKQPSENNAS